jgi:adenosylcobinamide amidohydrolase
MIKVASRPTTMHWETLLANSAFSIRRSGRFLVTELLTPHRVLSTSACNGGESEQVLYLVNHQSCEASGHHERAEAMGMLGPENYHHQVCRQLDLPAEAVASMGTAANMNYATIRQSGDDDVVVTAVVTAGVAGNAACAGDPTTWHETSQGRTEPVLSVGTINIEVLLGCPVTEGALARAVDTMTQAKAAALHRLAVRSRYSLDLATGTTTDQFCIAAPLHGNVPRRYTGTGTKLGEYIGASVLGATVECLRWHNGLEPSYTRGVFHALGRYGVKEEQFPADLAPYLDEKDLELLKKNRNSVMYEPLVSAAAYALAGILDRCRYGVFPSSVAREVLRQQAACLAANLAGRMADWPEFHDELPEADIEDPKRLILSSIALGWSKKWR